MKSNEEGFFEVQFQNAGSLVRPSQGNADLVWMISSSPPHDAATMIRLCGQRMSDILEIRKCSGSRA